MTLRWPSGGHCRGGRSLLSNEKESPGVWGLAHIKERRILTIDIKIPPPRDLLYKYPS
jgi:hypothetical protein